MMFAVPVVATTTPLEAPLIIQIDSESTIEGNCYLFIKSKIPDLPATKDLVFDSIFPRVGKVTKIMFGEKPHFMLNLEIETTGIWVEHSNFGADEIKTSFLTWEYLASHGVKYQ